MKRRRWRRRRGGAHARIVSTRAHRLARDEPARAESSNAYAPPDARLNGRESVQAPSAEHRR